MGRPTLSVATFVCIAFFFACAPSRVILTFEPVDLDSRAMILSDDELSRVLSITSETAGSFGFESDTWTATTSAPAELLARYRRRDQETGYQRIGIQVIRMKDTGQTSIWVINRDGHSDEMVTRRVASALSEALASALPSRRIVLRRP